MKLRQSIYSISEVYTNRVGLVRGRRRYILDSPIDSNSHNPGSVQRALPRIKRLVERYLYRLLIAKEKRVFSANAVRHRLVRGD